MSELTYLDGTPEQIKLSSGAFVVIEDLKSRQFFKFLRIITHGALPILNDLKLFQMKGDDLDANEFGTQLLSALLLSVPDAEEEAIDFVQSMVKPVGLIEGRRLNKLDTERNNALWASVEEDLDNPELDDLVSIIEAVVRREAADIQALGKRLLAMFKLAEKTGQIPTVKPGQSLSQTHATGTSSADSAELSISFPPNTDGTTNVSETSASNGSVSVSPQSTNDAGTSTTESSSS